MRNIDKMLYEVLFKKREVKNAKLIYTSLFNQIWPQQKNFENFLLSSENTLKIEYAKKIYNSLIMVNDIFLPNYLIMEVLNDQYTDLMLDNNGYIAQDHIVHSINLYILGIYLFFNSSFFFNKIIKNNNGFSNLQSKIESFILKWQIFAYYHDVGYYFEPKKKRKKYDILNGIDVKILRLQLIKNLTRLIVYKTIAEKSERARNILNLKEFRDIGKDFFDVNGNKIANEELLAKLNLFEGAICLEGINNEYDFSGILPLIESNYLSMLYDENGTVVAIFVRSRDDTLYSFLTKVAIKEEIIIGNKIQIGNNNYKIKYFVLDINNDSFWKKSIDGVLIDTVYSKLTKELNNYLEFYSFNDYTFSVFEWVKKIIPNGHIDFNVIYNKIKLDCQKEVLQTFLIEQINSLNSIKADNVQNIFNIFKKKLDIKNLKKKLEPDVTALIDNKFGNAYDVIGAYSSQFNTIVPIKEFNELAKDLCIFNFRDRSKVKKLQVFNHSSTDNKQKQLHEKINKLSIDLGIELDKLKEYRLKFMAYDHGLVSASLVFEITAINECLRKLFKNNKISCLSWSEPLNDDELRISSYAEVIFAILLHNIYCKESGVKGSLSYKQDININSFSYFCSFCDVIQRWGRVKQVNLAQVNLPHIHLLEDDFDLTLDSDGTTTLWCLPKYENYMKNIIKESDPYLPGFSLLVKVNRFN